VIDFIGRSTRKIIRRTVPHKVIDQGKRVIHTAGHTINYLLGRTDWTTPPKGLDFVGGGRF